jgi:hypothetical protein
LSAAAGSRAWLQWRTETISSAARTTRSVTSSPVASSSSWPGVRITTASGAAPIWISSGSSRATASWQACAAPSEKRTTSSRAVASVGAAGSAWRGTRTE